MAYGFRGIRGIRGHHGQGGIEQAAGMVEKQETENSHEETEYGAETYDCSVLMI